MATARERIIAYLQKHPEGVDDDELARALGLRQRQQANAICRQLAGEGLVVRRVVSGKIHNFWQGTAEPEISPPPPQISIPEGAPWFWEGNVQAAVVRFLEARGYTILCQADAGRRERGKDIEAQTESGLLWVTVKGYPQRALKTMPSTQAGHWFKDAFFDLVSWRGERPDVSLAMALPDFPRYRRLAERIRWLQPVLKFAFLWVAENGNVHIEGSL
jgi:hypothetical protein